MLGRLALAMRLVHVAVWVLLAGTASPQCPAGTTEQCASVCPGGFATADGGCARCEPGKQSADGTATCTFCGDARRPNAAQDACECRPSAYGDDCLLCPPGAVCAGGDAEPKALAGSWVYKGTMEAGENGSAPVAAVACLPTRAGQPSRCLHWSGCEASAGNVTESNCCAGGFGGSMCESCVGTKMKLNGNCVQCLDSWGAVRWGRVLIGTGWAVGFILFILHVASATFADADGTATICIFFFQIMALVFRDRATSINAPFTASVLTFLDMGFSEYTACYMYTFQRLVDPSTPAIHHCL